MNHLDYIKLRDTSQSSTFVTRNKLELHKQVRSYLTHAVGTYASEEGSHSLDAKTGIRVALEFNSKYASFVKSAMSQVNGAVRWEYSKSGDVKYTPLNDKTVPPVPVGEVLAKMNDSLDEVDALTARAPLTDEDKRKRSAKSITSRLTNMTPDTITDISDHLGGVAGDDLLKLQDVMTTLMTAVQIKISSGGHV